MKKLFQINPFSWNADNTGGRDDSGIATPGGRFYFGAELTVPPPPVQNNNNGHINKLACPTVGKNRDLESNKTKNRKTHLRKLVVFAIAVMMVNLFFLNDGYAQIAQRGTATTAAINTTSVSINKPSGVVQNDVMIVNIEQGGNDATDAYGSGWIVIDGAVIDGGGKHRHQTILYKVAGASEGTSYTFTLGAGVNEGSAAIVAFYGVDATGGYLVGGGIGGPFDVAPGAINAPLTDGTTATATTLTTSTANAAVIMFASMMDGTANAAYSGWTTTSPGNLTELYDYNGGAEAIGAAWATKSTAGSTGNGTVTLSAGKKWGAILIALKEKTTSTINTNNIPASNLCYSSAKVPIQSFYISQTTPSRNLTGLSFTTNGSYSATGDITKFQLWTNNTNSLVGATQISSDITSSLGTGAHSFAAFNQTLEASSNRYFWITMDVASTPSSGHTLDVSALTTTNITVSGGTTSGTSAAGGSQTLNTAGTWIGVTSTDWNTSTNWCGGVPSSTTDVVIPAGTTNAPTIAASTTAVCRNITINSSATLTLTNSATSLLNISGDFTNNGALSAGSASILSFVGSSAQDIAGSSTTTFSNLTINETAASITVTSSASAFNVSGNLTVSQGNLILQATNANCTIAGNLNVAANGTLTHSVNWDTNSRLLSVGGNLTIDGTFTYTTRSHVQMTGAGSKTIKSGSSAFSILTLLTGAYSASGALTVNDNFYPMFNSTGSFNTNGQSVTARAGCMNYGGTITIDGGNLSVTGGLFVGSNSVATTNGTVSLSSGSLISDGITLGSTINSTANTITQSGGTLQVNGAVTINQPAAAVTNAWNINAQTATVTGLITFAGSNTTTSRIGKVVITTGTLNANGGMTFVAGAAACHVIDMSGGAGRLNLKGALTVPAASSTLTAGTSGSIFDYADTNAQTINFFSAGAYHNLYIDNTNTTTGASLSAAITATNVTGNISVGSVNSGSLFTTGNYTITSAASKSLTVAANSTINAGNSIITFGTTPPNPAAIINGTFKTANTTAFTGTANGSINTTNSPVTSLGNSSTVEYNATAPQSVTARTYNNLTLSGSGNKTISNGTGISSSLSISGTAKGLLANGGTSTATTLTLGGVNQTTGSWGSTGSLATNKNDTWFVAANTGIINVNTGCTAGTWLGTTSTDWNDPSNWCSGIPTSTTDVSISSTAPHQPVISSASGSCRNITIGGSASLTISVSSTLTVSGTFINTGTFTADAASTVSFIGTGAQTIPALNYSNLTLTGARTTNSVTLASGTINVASNLNLSGLTFSSGAIISTGNTINFSGGTQSITLLQGSTTNRLNNVSTSGSSNVSVAMVAGSGNTQLDILGNLSLNGTSKFTVTNNIVALVNITGTTSVASGCELWLQSSMTSTFTGAVSISGAVYRSLGASGTSLNFGGLVTINNGGYLFGANLVGHELNVNLSGGLTNNGNFYSGSGTYTFKDNSQALTGALSIPNVTVTGIMLTNNNILTVGTALAGTGTLTQGSNSTLNIGGTSTITNLTATSTGNMVNYTGAAQTVNQTTYYNLNLSGSDNKTIANGTTINNNLSISGSAKGLLSDGGSSSTLSLTLGGMNQAIGSYGSSGSSATFKNDSWFTAPNTGILNVSSGCSAGTWTGTTSTDWNTASNWCGGIPNTTTNVVINSGGNQPIIGSAGGVCHDLTLGSGASLTINGTSTLSLSGSWSNSGTFTKNSSTVTFNGTNSTQTLSGTTTFNNLTIDHSGSGVVSAAGSTLVVAGLCYVKTGTLISSSDYASVQIDSGCTLECVDGGTLSVSTSWTNNGTFIPGVNGTVDFDGTPTTIQPGTGTNSFNHILITTGLTVSSANINVAGNFTNNGTFTHSSGTVTFIGTSTIYGTTANNSFYNVLITGSLTVPNANLNIARNFTNNGTFTHNSGTITFNGGTTQNLSGTSGSTFNNLAVTSSSAVNLAGTGSGKLTTVSGDLTISSGILTVDPTNQLTVLGNVNNSAGNSGLVLASTSSGTASLIHNTSNVPATINRYISGTAEAWHFLSSPVAAQAISGDWLPSGTYGGTGGTGYDLYLWDEPTSCWKYKLNAKWDSLNSAGNNFTAGRGYLYSVQATLPTKSFAGNLNNGSVSSPLKFAGTDPAVKGFNLVGNPYPSSVDWQASSGWGRTSLAASGGGYDIWIWSPTASNYGTFNSATGVSTNSVTRYIAPMQGFFVLATSSGSLGFSNTVRVHDATTPWKSAQLKDESVSLVVQSEKDHSSDEVRMLFGYLSNQSGAPKLFSPVATAPSLYLNSGNSNYTVRYLSDTIAYPTVPVNFKAGSNGAYTLSFTFDSGTFKNIFLEDKQTKVILDLKSEPLYRFNASVGDQAGRFVLHFVPVKPHTGTELPARIYTDGHKIFIDLTKVVGETRVSAYDVLGRKAWDQTLTGESLHPLSYIHGTQFLIIQLQNPQGRLVRKIVCNNTSQ